MSFLRPPQIELKLSQLDLDFNFFQLISILRTTSNNFEHRDTTQQTMAAMTEAEMMAVLALDSSDSDSDGNAGGGSMIAPVATEQPVNLNRVQDGMQIKLWRRVISFLSVCEQAVSVRGMSHFFRQCSDAYMQKFWSEPILHMPQDAPSLASLMELVQRLTEEEGYVEGTTVVVAVGSGVHEVVGSCKAPWGATLQKMLSVPCNNLSFVGQGEGVTIVEGGLVVENGRKVSVEGLTMKNASGLGVVASGAGTEIVLKKMTVEECQWSGVVLRAGAQLVATECHFHQNGQRGVCVYGSTTTVRLTNCTSHHNKDDGVFASSGAVVDLMGAGTSVHDNEGNGLAAYYDGSTINVYQPCVLNDMSHGNKRQNIREYKGGRVQQKDSKK